MKICVIYLKYWQWKAYAQNYNQPRHPLKTDLTLSAHFSPSILQVKDEEDDKEDLYTKVKDTEKDDGDDGYAHVKQDDITASADMNAANVVIDDEEDPYEKVMGDSGGGMVLVSQNIANPDDPYSVVLDQTAVMVLSRSTGASPPMAASNSSNDQGAGLNLNNSANGLGQDNHLRLQYADEEGDSQDDYATVVKDRSSPTSREGSNQGGGGDEEEIEPYFTTPPEPPRLYGASEVWGAGVGVMEETSTHGE